MNVAATDIQKPCDVLKLRQKKQIYTCLLHILPDTGKLILTALTGPFYIQIPCRLCRKGRTVRPDLTDEIFLAGNAHSLRRQQLLQLLRL